MGSRALFQSPKRSRRDGKPETERLPTEPVLDKDRTDRDHRHHRRLQDPLPLESGTVNKESEKGADGHKGVAKHSSDQTKLPQPRSYFQVSYFRLFFAYYCGILWGLHCIAGY